LSEVDWSSIREAHQASRHAVEAVDGGYQARNPGQRWTTQFDGRGFTTAPDAGVWSWGLELVSYGRAGAERVVEAPQSVTADGPRVAYAWDELLTEWYVNDGRGLEHGYSVFARPAGDAEELMLDLAIRGNLEASVSSDGRDVRFADAEGSTLLNYSGLTVFDAEDRTLAARFALSITGLRLTVDDSDAVYPLTIDPVAQQAYVKASNTDSQDLFGNSVVLSGDTMVIGAVGESSDADVVDGDQADNSAPSAGAAYVFVRNGAIWSQQAYLKAFNSDGAPIPSTSGDLFGFSMSISGDTIVVGAPREDSSASGVGGDPSDNSLQDAGAAYVFVRNGTTWSQQAYLKASNPDSVTYFGSSVSISGDTIVVGSPDEDSNATGVNGDQGNQSAFSAGAAYVFVRSGTTWSQQAYLKASNTDAFDTFGEAVAVDGDTVVVAASFEDSGATGVDGDQRDDSAPSAGAAYVFVRNGTTWSQQAYLKASNTEAGDRLGSAVSVSGETVVVGAWLEASGATGVDGDSSDNSEPQSGAAYVFERSGATWSQQAYLKASNTEGGLGFFQGDNFGADAVVTGDTIVVGAMSEDSNATGIDGNGLDNNAESAGAAYVFRRAGTVWSQLAYLKASNTQASDRFGTAVAIDGDTVIVGAAAEDSGATGVGGDQGNGIGAAQSGAAYVFELGDPAECFLVVGDLPGTTNFYEVNHLFTTQVGPVIEGSYPVLLDDVPEFVLPTGVSTRVAAVGSQGPMRTTLAKPPRWLLDGQFAVQVMMWNPVAFPGLPEQCTAGLFVVVQPDGTVHTEPYGTSVGGLEIWHEIDTNAAGQKVIRFPFSIPGM